jgi:hypothetical protein
MPGVALQSIVKASTDKSRVKSDPHLTTFGSAQSQTGLEYIICLTILSPGRGFLRRQVRRLWKETPMSIGTIVLIILVLALIGVIPTWPHSRGWGYGPSGVVGFIVVVLLILLLLGRI